MDLTSKKVGIWGLGVVGRSALEYFSQKNIPVTVMDKKILSQSELALLRKKKIQYFEQHNWQQFFEENDLILASPGIDLRKFSHYKNKFITELDIVAHECKNRRIIAITGTVGKTSVTHLLSSILRHHNPTITAGNIGTGMLNIINNKQKTVVLELSSFQLEQCKLFAPDLALWTNFFPNHLDRHTTLEDYFTAKYSIIAHQNKGQQALIPLDLAKQVMHKNMHNPSYQGTLNFFCLEKPCLHTYNWLPGESTLFWIEDGYIVRYNNKEQQKLLSLHSLDPITFPINWLMIIAALTLLEIPLSLITNHSATIPEHRIEKVGTYKGIEFYNDSKATIMESTIAALNKLQGKPTILFLGGLSKGIDRTPALAQLRSKTKHLICFGAEAQHLQSSAQAHSISSSSFTTLQEAFAFSLTIAQHGDQLLFSPGGSSYDLFSNYEERGNSFKELVQKLIM